jgi:antibiotic biosynthesis monooxygenase (ABM) superfamily enzyme
VSGAASTTAGWLGPMTSRLKFVLLAWLAAFLIVMALFAAFGEQLEDLSLPLRALTISGVLVVSMTQVALPLIHRLLRR